MRTYQSDYKHSTRPRRSRSISPSPKRRPLKHSLSEKQFNRERGWNSRHAVASETTWAKPKPMASYLSKDVNKAHTPSTVQDHSRMLFKESLKKLPPIPGLGKWTDGSSLPPMYARADAFSPPQKLTITSSVHETSIMDGYPEHSPSAFGSPTSDYSEQTYISKYRQYRSSPSQTSPQSPLSLDPVSVMEQAWGKKAAEAALEAAIKVAHQDKIARRKCNKKKLVHLRKSKQMIGLSESFRAKKSPKGSRKLRVTRQTSTSPYLAAISPVHSQKKGSKRRQPSPSKMVSKADQAGQGVPHSQDTDRPKRLLSTAALMHEDVPNINNQFSISLTPVKIRERNDGETYIDQTESRDLLHDLSPEQLYIYRSFKKKHQLLESLHAGGIHIDKQLRRPRTPGSLIPINSHLAYVGSSSCYKSEVPISPQSEKQGNQDDQDNKDNQDNQDSEAYVDDFDEAVSSQLSLDSNQDGVLNVMDQDSPKLAKAASTQPFSQINDQDDSVLHDQKDNEHVNNSSQQRRCPGRMGGPCESQHGLCMFCFESDGTVDFDEVSDVINSHIVKNQEWTESKARTLFDKLDVHQDGFLYASEIATALSTRSDLQVNWDSTYVHDLFASACVDESEFLTFDEFWQTLKCRSSSFFSSSSSSQRSSPIWTESKARTLFDKLDIHGDGYLYMDEVKETLASCSDLGVVWTSADVIRLFKSAHVDEDEFLTFDEFLLHLDSDHAFVPPSKSFVFGKETQHISHEYCRGSMGGQHTYVDDSRACIDCGVYRLGGGCPSERVDREVDHDQDKVASY